VPTTDYYTRHYLTATMIVWATTFSLLTLFLPKLHAFFIPEKADSHEDILGKGSDLSGRQRMSCRHNAVGIIADSPTTDDDDEDRFIPPPQFEFTDNQSNLMNLNNMINNSQHTFNNSRVKLSNLSRKGRMQGVLMEVHEVNVYLL
jgi:hypothetical protein